MAASLWHRLGCCLTGHDYAITSDGRRMFLCCRNCGQRSHGLEIAQGPLPNRSHTPRASAPAMRSAANRSEFAAR
jgi:hypothetical protein